MAEDSIKKNIEYNYFFLQRITLVVVPSIPFPGTKFLKRMLDDQGFLKWVGRVAEFHQVAIFPGLQVLPPWPRSPGFGILAQPSPGQALWWSGFGSGLQVLPPWPRSPGFGILAQPSPGQALWWSGFGSGLQVLPPGHDPQVLASWRSAPHGLVVWFWRKSPGSATLAKIPGFGIQAQRSPWSGGLVPALQWFGIMVVFSVLLLD